MTAYDIIIKPILSEKSYDGIADKKYVFMVHPDATKTQIKNAVEEIFEVKVEKVNTINVTGKMKEWAEPKAAGLPTRKPTYNLPTKASPSSSSRVLHNRRNEQWLLRNSNRLPLRAVS